MDDTWVAVKRIQPPSRRYDHTAVWTGVEMIIWGGGNAGSQFNDGSRYNPVANTGATTNYTVTITDPSGCTGSDNVTIYSDPKITINKTEFDVSCNGLCDGQTIVIPTGGSPGYTFNWSSGCTAAACSALCPGTYTVTVTDSWGCSAVADTTVNQPPVLVASITSTTSTSCNAVCDGTATASSAGRRWVDSHSWKPIPI